MGSNEPVRNECEVIDQVYLECQVIDKVYPLKS